LCASTAMGAPSVRRRTIARLSQGVKPTRRTDERCRACYFGARLSSVQYIPWIACSLLLSTSIAAVTRNRVKVHADRQHDRSGDYTSADFLLSIWAQIQIFSISLLACFMYQIIQKRVRFYECFPRFSVVRNCENFKVWLKIIAYHISGVHFIESRNFCMYKIYMLHVICRL